MTEVKGSTISRRQLLRAGGISAGAVLLGRRPTVRHRGRNCSDYGERGSEGQDQRSATSPKYLGS